MLYGELGRLPLSITVCKRVISYWHKLELTNLPIKMSKLTYLLCKSDIKSFHWLNYVQKTLDSCGLSYVFQNPLCTSTNHLIVQIERILKDQFFQSWQVSVRNSSKGLYYQYIKDFPSFEKYLLFSKSISIPILRFITSNHNLPVETGRWINTPRELRTCKLCKSPSIADEFHYIFRCEAFATERYSFIAKEFITYPNLYTLKKTI